MASELRVDTLKSANGSNSIATSFVAGGSAKMRVNFDGTATFNSDDDEIRESFNVGSTIDNGTGNYDVTFTSPMSNANYSVGGTCAHDIPISANRDSNFQAVAESNSQINVNIFSSSQQDRAHVYTQSFGDLL